MYRIDLDEANKIVIAEIAGQLELNEINSLIDNLSHILERFEKQEYSMLILAQRFDPIAQKYLKKFEEAVFIYVNYSKKVAIVHGNRFLSKAQMQKIENEVIKRSSIETDIQRFKTKKEALNFLLHNTKQ